MPKSPKEIFGTALAKEKDMKATADAVNEAAFLLHREGETFCGGAYLSDVRLVVLGMTGLVLTDAELIAMHREGLIALRRLDLVQAADPERIRASELADENATYHLVEPRE